MDFENGKARLVLQNDTLTAFVSGEIDHHSARGIREAIDAALMANSPDNLIIDLSDVSFMDSSGLGLVLGRYTKAREAGIAFSVTGANERFTRMFDMAGLDRLFSYKSDKKANKGKETKK